MGSPNIADVLHRLPPLFLMHVSGRLRQEILPAYSKLETLASDLRNLRLENVGASISSGLLSIVICLVCLPSSLTVCQEILYGPFDE